MGILKMMEMFYVFFIYWVAFSPMWLLSICNVASTAKEVNFYFYSMLHTLNVYMGLVDIYRTALESGSPPWVCFRITQRVCEVTSSGCWAPSLAFPILHVVPKWSLRICLLASSQVHWWCRPRHHTSNSSRTQPLRSYPASTKSESAFIRNPQMICTNISLLLRYNCCATLH